MDEHMKHWQSIPLEDYEGFLDVMGQREILEEARAGQFAAYPGHTVVVLGAATGTGFEYAYGRAFDKIYAVDINGEFLRACEERHTALGDTLETMQLDVQTEADKLPQADMLLADLVIEHIGKWAFLSAVRQVRPTFVSCVFYPDTRAHGYEDLGLPPDSPFSKIMAPIANDHNPITEHQLDAMLGWYGRAGTWTQKSIRDRTVMRIDYLPRRTQTSKWVLR